MRTVGVMTSADDDCDQHVLTAMAAAIAEASDPIQRLLLLTELVAAAEEVQRRAVAECRAAGATWDTIAGALKVSKQSANRRFRGPADDDGGAPAAGTRAETSKRGRRRRGYDVTLPGGLRILHIAERQ